jgi:prephenate dehydrogenase
MFQRVALIGLGLIGGSLGLALRQGRAAQEVLGFDLGRGVIDQARKAGAIDQGYTTLADAVRGAELVILATPVGAMRVLLRELSPLVGAGAVVTDVASTKEQVIAWAEEALPPGVFFLGGHPMAGKEVSGVQAADPALFRNCIYCLTPTTKTAPVALRKVSQLIEALGARRRLLDPVEHDRQVAQVSHLPFLAASALMHSVIEQRSWGEAALLASSGFRDTTRLSAGSPEMYRDICLTNQAAVLQALDDYMTMLQTYRAHIAKGDPQLDELFTEARQARQQWQVDYERAAHADVVLRNS